MLVYLLKISFISGGHAEKGVRLRTPNEKNFVVGKKREGAASRPYASRGGESVSFSRTTAGTSLRADKRLRGIPILLNLRAVVNEQGGEEIVHMCKRI